MAWNAAPGAQEVIGEVEQLVCAPPEGHAEGLDNVRARAISLSNDPTERENKQRARERAASASARTELDDIVAVAGTAAALLN